MYTNFHESAQQRNPRKLVFNQYIGETTVFHLSQCSVVGSKLKVEVGVGARLIKNPDEQKKGLWIRLCLTLQKSVCVWGGDGDGDGGGGKPLGSDVTFTMLTTSCTMQRAIYN